MPTLAHTHTHTLTLTLSLPSPLHSSHFTPQLHPSPSPLTFTPHPHPSPSGEVSNKLGGTSFGAVLDGLSGKFEGVDVRSQKSLIKQVREARGEQVRVRS